MHVQNAKENNSMRNVFSKRDFRLLFAEDFAISGQVAALDIVNYEGDKTKTIERMLLGN